MTNIVRSQIHLALGTTERLDYAMVLQAVDMHLRETDTLDWKATLHDDPAEFAKDVAALANSRGGLIVIGVAEVKAEASRVVGVEFSDATDRKLRGWLTNHVQPTLHDVRFIFLSEPASDTRGVLVISVPASPGMPHLVTAIAGQQSQTAWPRRNGTRTDWMREYDIERAYQDRFARRVADEAALSALVDLSIDALDASVAPWLIAAARPTNPIPSTSKPPTKDQIVEVLKETFTLSAAVRPVGERYPSSMIASVGQLGLSPVVGLRRWVTSSRHSGVPDARSSYGHVEIHHDGSILLAAPCGSWGTSLDGKAAMQDWLLGAVVADLVCLIERVSDLGSLDSGYVVRLEPRQMGTAHPYALTTAWMGNYMVQRESQVHGSLDVRRFVPVETELPQMMGVEHQRLGAWALLRDVVAQFGLEPSAIGWPSPESPI